MSQEQSTAESDVQTEEAISQDVPESAPEGTEDSTTTQPVEEPAPTNSDDELRGAIERKKHFRDKSQKLEKELEELKAQVAESSKWKDEVTQLQQQSIRDKEIIKKISHLAPDDAGREAWIDDVTNNLVSSDAVKVERGEDGTVSVSGIDDAISSLQENKPYLFSQRKKAVNTAATVQPSAESTSQKTAMSLSDIETMDPVEFQRNAARIIKGVAEGDIK